MPLLALLALFVIVPLAELYVILEVGDAIGWWQTILILAADSLIGSLLLKSQGRAVWRRFSEQMAAGRMPHREVLDGVFVIFGGAFLITPGFLTDIVGIMLLLPPTRAIVRRLLTRAVGGRLMISVADAAGRRRGPDRGRATYDVDGSATDAESETTTAPRLPR